MKSTEHAHKIYNMKSTEHACKIYIKKSTEHACTINNNHINLLNIHVQSITIM